MSAIHRSLWAIGLLGIAHLAPFSAISSAVLSTAQAATQNAAPPAPPAPPAKPPVIRAPLAPPPINDMTRAYEFRTQLRGDPHCQRFATEADALFLYGNIDDQQKGARLKVIGDAAKAAGCVN